VQTVKAQQAAVESAQATLKVAERQIDLLKAQRATDEANLAQAKATRDQAELNLSYTIVTPSEPGRVTNGRDLGHRQLQGEPARRDAPRSAGHDRNRRLS
jgi:multidrug resistance efflux pump